MTLPEGYEFIERISIPNRSIKKIVFRCKLCGEVSDRWESSRIEKTNICKNKSCDNYSYKKPKGFSSRKRDEDLHIGESIINKQGLKCTIISRCDGNSSYIVEFEDGVQRQVDYKSFSVGNVPHPDYSGSKYVGKIIKDKDGVDVLVVKLHRSIATVKYPDGFEKEVGLKSLKKSVFSRDNKKTIEDYIGLQSYSNFGLLAEIIDGTSSKDIVIKFINGSVKKLRTVQQFKNGQFLPDGITHTKNGYEGVLNGYEILGDAFSLNDKEDKYYNCIKDGENYILRPIDMIKDL